MHEPGKNVGLRPINRATGEWDAPFTDTDLDLLLGELKAPEEVSPRPGFYARVMDRIESQRPKSIWSVFLEPLFGRRLAVASGVLMLVLGAAMFVPGSEFDDQVVAKSQLSLVVNDSPDQDKDAVLVNLVTYQEQ